MKIGYIAPTGVFGGVRIVAEHLNRLAARGHETVFLWTDKPMEWLPLKCEQRPVSDAGSGYDRVVGTAIGLWPTAKTMADENHCGAFGLMQMAEWMFAVKGSETETKTVEAFTTPMDGVMAISEWLAKVAETVHPPDRIHRIRNGIDTGLFFPDPIAEIRNTNEFVVVVEGYENNRAKDIGGMVRRCLRRFEMDHGKSFRLIGFSQFKPTMDFDAFWQNPSQMEIRRIYSSADVFLKASRWEGRPGPDMEAMACGVAVCRAITTGDDDLMDGVNCLKVPYWDDDGFLANFAKLYDERETRSQLAAAGATYVKERYQWDGAIDLVEETLTGTVTAAVGDVKQPDAYSLDSYDGLQEQIAQWETPQATWLGEMLNRVVEPTTVVDFGCGPGTYLIPFKQNAKVLGVDGAPKAGGFLERSEYVSVDFREDESFLQIDNAARAAGMTRKEWRGNPIAVEADVVWPMDLALCIETAEHLPADRGEWLVNALTVAARVVFWSAAQPGQGGTGHINERPKAYWLDLFRARGWDLHPANDWLADRIANNEHCQKVRWLIGNAMLLVAPDVDVVKREEWATVDTGEKNDDGTKAT